MLFAKAFKKSADRVAIKAFAITLLAGLIIASAIAAAFAGGGSSLKIFANSPGGLFSLPQFRLFLAVTIGCVILISAGIGMLFKIGASRRDKKPGSQAGTVLIEFTLILPILVMISLVMIQSSMLMGGYLCVNYATYCASRSAIVYVPTQLGDEPRNQMSSFDNPYDSEKLARIRAAAVFALIPTGDSSHLTTADNAGSLTSGISSLITQSGNTVPNWVDRLLPGRLSYADEHAKVTIIPPADNAQFGEHEDIKLILEYDLYLSVPFAGRLLALMDSQNSVDLGDGKYALKVTLPCALTNEGRQDWIDTEIFPD